MMRCRIALWTAAFVMFAGGSLVAAPLHDAVLSRNIVQVNQLIAQGVNIDQRDEFGFAPLHWAVRDNQVEIVRVLIAAGADVNITTGVQDGSRSTPLHYAVSEDNDALLKLLLSNGADINITDSDGNTPLHLASMFCSGVSVINIVEYDNNQTVANSAGRVPGELQADACLLPVVLYDPDRQLTIADADDTYIAGIHELRGIGLWGGAALVSPAIFVMISSIVNENFGDDVIFADSVIDDLVFGGLIAGTSSVFFTAIETAVNVQSHHLFGISLTYGIAAAALTTTTVLLAANGGLTFMTMVPSVWYWVLAITGTALQVDALQQTQTVHRVDRNAGNATAIASNDIDGDVGGAGGGGGIKGGNTDSSVVGMRRWQPTVVFAGSHIVIRY